MKYPIRVEKDSVGYMATCRDLPTFVAAGDTVEETLRNSVEMLETTISIYIDERKTVPAASVPEDGEHLVRVPTSTELKSIISDEMIAQGISNAELARRMGSHAPHIGRLLDVNHKTKMDVFDSAIESLGKQFVITAKTA
ncbi:Antitoxin HicB [Halomonadaceae bacterium LMG 33818]|uniref:type II toxin-antitoxin system HicB family antitoxin n=1 Tax=Cernens ardua TaxID=3402176 RepID=UPI003EDC6CC6